MTQGNFFISPLETAVDDPILVTDKPRLPLT